MPIPVAPAGMIEAGVKTHLVPVLFGHAKFDA
jgi:hypothetical protein